MTFAFDFHPEARAEFFADVDWYDERGFDVGETWLSRTPSVDRATGVSG